MELRFFFILDDLDCTIVGNTLIVKTVDGSDFWTNDDWLGDWSLYFRVDNGIRADASSGSDQSSKDETGNVLQDGSVKVENLPEHFYTKVSCQTQC